MPEKVTGKRLAEVLGITQGRITQLADEGVLVREEPGNGRKLYDLCESVQAYIAFVRETARGKSSSDKDAEARKLQADADYKTAKARQEELKLAELEGRMHSAEDVEAATTELVYAVRSSVLAMPGRIAVDAEMKPAAEVAEVVRRECCAVLEGLADYQYDPKVYAQLVRERRGWQVEETADAEE